MNNHHHATSCAPGDISDAMDVVECSEDLDYHRYRPEWDLPQHFACNCSLSFKSKLLLSRHLHQMNQQPIESDPIVQAAQLVLNHLEKEIDRFVKAEVKTREIRKASDEKFQAAAKKSRNAPKPVRCVACFEKPRQVCYIKCGHVSYCTDCHNEVGKKNPTKFTECPCCRNRGTTKTLRWDTPPNQKVN